MTPPTETIPGPSDPCARDRHALRAIAALPLGLDGWRRPLVRHQLYAPPGQAPSSAASGLTYGSFLRAVESLVASVLIERDRVARSARVPEGYRLTPQGGIIDATPLPMMPHHHGPPDDGPPCSDDVAMKPDDAPMMPPDDVLRKRREEKRIVSDVIDSIEIRSINQSSSGSGKTSSMMPPMMSPVISADVLSLLARGVEAQERMASALDGVLRTLERLSSLPAFAVPPPVAWTPPVALVDPGEPFQPPPEREQGPDPFELLWGRIRETLKGEGVPERGSGMKARQTLYAMFARPGARPEPDAVLSGLRRSCRDWRTQAGELRAAGPGDPWKFVPALSMWIEERRWEAAPVPDAPLPVAASTSFGWRSAKERAGPTPEELAARKAEAERLEREGAEKRAAHEERMKNDAAYAQGVRAREARAREAERAHNERMNEAGRHFGKMATLHARPLRGVPGVAPVAEDVRRLLGKNGSAS